MKELILETLIDTLKIIPFLFIAFIIIELAEHKLSNQSKKIITKSKKHGPVIAALLGIIPQCGISALATNLYITRIITLGTLISIYLSTSDEMLPILISHNVNISLIIKILTTKVLFALLYGISIDFIINKIRKKEKETFKICEKEHCHCDEGLLKSTIKHTLNISVFILIISFIINIIFKYIGEDFLSTILLKNTIFGPFITSLIGLIPNCGASVILTELFLNKAISLAAFISGLLTGSGAALIILLKNNKNMKENLLIISLLYILGSISGVIIELINLIIKS